MDIYVTPITKNSIATYKQDFHSEVILPELPPLSGFKFQRNYYPLPSFIKMYSEALLIHPCTALTHCSFQ